MLVFPTAESPMMTTLTRQSYFSYYLLLAMYCSDYRYQFLVKMYINWILKLSVKLVQFVKVNQGLINFQQIWQKLPFNLVYFKIKLMILFNFNTKSYKKLFIYAVINQKELKAMMENQNISGNAYIQFSFEKSLRKYEKAPHKRVKNADYSNSKNNPIGECSLSKLYRRSSVPSTDKNANLHSGRKIPQFLSREKQNQLSSNKIKKQLQNSKNLAKNSGHLNNLSESNVKQQRSDLKLDDISNFNEDLFECRRSLFPSQKNAQKHHLNNMENQLSIQKNLKIESEDVKYGRKTQNTSQFKESKYRDGSQSQFIIEQQNKPFDRSYFNQPLQLAFSKVELDKSCETEENYNLNKNLTMSYAYFSSCSSLYSCQSQHDATGKEDQTLKQPRQQLKNEKGSQIYKMQMPIDAAIQKIIAQNQQNTVELLKHESKEELKKQYRNQYRQRVIYRIKKVNQLESSYSQCQNISQSIKKQLQLSSMSQSRDQANKSQTQTEQSQLQKLPISDKASIFEENNFYRHENSNKIDSYAISSAQYFEQEHQRNLIYQEDQGEDYIEQSSFKRDRSHISGDRDNAKKKHQKKSKRINFQIQNGYKCLGRIKIAGLDPTNQSICLSIRRFSTSSRPFSDKNERQSQKSKNGIDKDRLINYLIAQRPYLQKNRVELFALLSEIVDQKVEPNQMEVQNQIL